MEKEMIISLAKQAQQNDKDALNKLLCDFYPQLYYFTYKQVQNEELAADICQDTCISIMTSITSLKDPCAFVWWSYQIAANKAKRYIKVSSRELQFAEDENGESMLEDIEDESELSLPEKVAEDKEFCDIMLNMINALPTEQRTALMLYYYEKLSVAEIAKIQGVSSGTVKSRLNYGRRAIKRKVEEYEQKNCTKLHAIPALLFYLFSEDTHGITVPHLILPTAVSGIVGYSAEMAATASSAGMFINILAIILSIAVLGGSLLGISHWIKYEYTPNIWSEKATDSKKEPVEILGKDSQKETETDTSREYAQSTEDTAEGTADSEQVPDDSAEDAPDSEQVPDEGDDSSGGDLSGGEPSETEPDETTPITEPSGLAFSSRGNNTCVVTGIEDTSLVHVVIPSENAKGETVIGVADRAFLSSDIETVTLPSSVKTVEEFAFASCSNLTSIYGAENLSTIQAGAFQKNPKLTELDLSGATLIEDYVCLECPSLKKAILPQSLSKLPQGMFCDSGKDLEIVWPSNLEAIGNGAFQNSKLKKITLPSTVKEIERYAFRYCYELESIQLSASLEIIGAMAFEQCNSLKTLELPNTLSYIAGNAFFYCASLENIKIPDSVTTLGGYAFQGCTALFDVILPTSLSEITEGLFMYCSSLESIKIPTTVSKIGSRAFAYSGLKAIALPDNCTSIGTFSFSECKSLKSIYFGKALQSIPNYAISNCTLLEEAILPDTVKSIGSYAFGNCTSLKKLYLANQIESISNYAFNCCTALSSVFLPKSLYKEQYNTNESGPFEGCADNLRLFSDAEGGNSSWKAYFGYTTFGVSYEEYLQGEKLR